MCNALEHFMEALNILAQSETLTEKQEDLFVRELSQYYRIEHIVAQIPGIEMYRKIGDIVDRALRRCSLESNVIDSQLDEDARICYALLHMDSHELVVRFLDPCKKKYPKSIYFFELSAAVNGWLEQSEATLYDANIGLEIDSNYCELLYDKAVALRLLNKDMDEAIEAYRAFLAAAPEDHRKVPESYYAMAGCYFIRNGMTDNVKKTYTKGEETEKLQLPCFLPYDSNSKTLLKTMFDAKIY
jgi:tetratricopeptide (TPR) repeat protein